MCSDLSGIKNKFEEKIKVSDNLWKVGRMKTKQLLNLIIADPSLYKDLFIKQSWGEIILKNLRISEGLENGFGVVIYSWFFPKNFFFPST